MNSEELSKTMKPTVRPADNGPVNQSPNNSVEKTAEWIPRALKSVKENFREAVYLLVILGYIFIAAFGHMEKLQNYLGYFFVMTVGAIVYKIWYEVNFRDIVYITIIFLLSSYLIFTEFGDKIISLTK